MFGEVKLIQISNMSLHRIVEDPRTHPNNQQPSEMKGKHMLTRGAMDARGIRGIREPGSSHCSQ